MVLAVRHPEPRRSAHRLRGHASPLTLALGAVPAAKRGEKAAANDLNRKKAKLVALTHCPIYVSEEIPLGNFTIIDPAALEPGERASCPFSVKTLVVHPDDIDKAIGHFSVRGDA